MTQECRFPNVTILLGDCLALTEWWSIQDLYRFRFSILCRILDAILGRTS